MAKAYKRSLSCGVCTDAFLACALMALGATLLHWRLSAGQAGSEHHASAARLASFMAADLDSHRHSHSARVLVEPFRGLAGAATGTGACYAALLFDETGAVLVQIPEDIDIVSRLAEAEKRQNDTVNLGGGLPTTTIQRVGLTHGGSVVVLSANEGPSYAHHVWLFASLLLIIAGASVCWIVRRIKRILSGLFDQLIRGSATVGSEDSALLPLTRDDEIGVVSRNIAHLRDECSRARVRAGQLERTMDVQITKRTQKVQRLLDRAVKQAWVDPLTKLGNRRLLDERLEELFNSQRSAKEDLAIVAFDLDNFKTLNDIRGHAAGDEILAFMGELLRGTLRSTDIGLRTGGDEFVAMLLGTDARQAAELAERLVKLFAQRASLLKVSPAVTLSAGVASLRHNRPESGADLLALADESLYLSKRNGKSTVAVSGKRVPSTLSAG